MYQLSIKTLLYLMMGLITIALTLPLTLVVSHQNKEISLMQHEKTGIAMIPELQQISILLAQHRGTANMLLNGNHQVNGHLQDLAQKIQTAINNASRQCLQLDRVLSLSCTKLQNLNQNWQQLQQTYQALGGRKSFAAHTLLIANIQAIQTDVADLSALSLDSVLSTSYLIDNMTRTMPDLMEKIAQLRGFGSGILAQQKITASEKTELTKLCYGVHLAMQSELLQLEKVFATLPGVKQRLAVALASSQTLAEQLISTTEQKIINAPSVNMQDHAFFTQSTAVIDSVMKLYLPIVETLNTELNQRITLLKWQRNITLASFVLFNLLVIGFISLVIRRINLPLKNAMACFKQIEAGHYDAPIAVIYQDEIGRLLESLEIMRNRITHYVKQLTQVVNSLEEAQRIARIGNWDWDLLADNLVWSDEVYRILGVDAERFQPSYQAFLQLLSEHERSKVQSEISQASQKPGRHFIDYRIYWANGSEKIINQHVETQFNPQGKAIRMVGTVQDITERKHAEQVLKESEERWKYAIEGAGDGVWDWNIKTGKVIYSKLWKQMIGYAEDEIGDDLAEWVQRSHPDETELVKKRLSDYFAGKTPNYNCETRLRCKDGSWKWVLDRGMIVSRDERGKPLRMIGIHTDITEHKRIEHAMNNAKIAAEQANQAKSEFLANMSHEIRTPMNAILGFSSILSDLITDSIQRYYLDAISKSGKTLLQLINDILDLSKIEAGKFTLQYSPVAVRVLLDEMAVIFSQKLNDKSISFSLNIAENVPAYLMLDEIRLRQILLNLIGNAVKFTEAGFIKVTVTAEPCANNAAVNLMIAVCDSGIGIAEDQHEQIFAAFTQQKQQSVAYGGTGLGLTICKRLLELMGGSISMQSERGKGSCFKLSLKNTKIIQKTQLPAVSNTPLTETFDFQPAMILVVDDLAFNRQLIKGYLAEFKELRIVEAESGEYALGLLKQCHFDLILMDRILPGEDGDAICRKIKRLPQCETIPIIMISASVLTLTAEQFPPAYNLQLDKPVNKWQLLTALHSFLRTKASTESMPQSLPAIAVTGKVSAANLEQNQALAVLLEQNYREQIAGLIQSGIFDIAMLLEIAEQLMPVAEQYQSEELYHWARNLKNQSELFDLDEISKTLKNFEVLLDNLQCPS